MVLGAAGGRRNLSFRLRLHSGVSTPASKLAGDPDTRALPILDSAGSEVEGRI